MRKTLFRGLASVSSCASTARQPCNLWIDNAQSAAAQSEQYRGSIRSHALSGVAPAGTARSDSTGLPTPYRSRATEQPAHGARVLGQFLPATSSPPWSFAVRGLAGAASPDLTLSSGPGKHARSVRERLFGAAWPTKPQVDLDKKLQKTDDPARILKTLQRARDAGVKLNPVSVTTALLQLTRGSRADLAPLRQHPMVQHLVWSLHEQLRLKPNTFSAHSVALSLYALARLSAPDAPHVRAIFDHALALARHRGVAHFSTRHLAYLAWSLAATAKRAPELFSAIETTMLQRGLNCPERPQALVQLAWSFAVSGHASSPLLPAIQRELSTRGLKYVSSKGIGQLAHAYGSLGATPASQGVLRLVQDAVMTRGLSHLGAQELSQVAWALARVRVAPAPGWRDAVVSDVLRRGVGAADGAVGGADLARLVWGMVANGHDVGELLSAVEAQVKATGVAAIEGKAGEARVEGAAGQGAAVAAAKAGSAEAVPCGVLAQLSDREWGDLQWAFAFAGHPGQELFKREIRA